MDIFHWIKRRLATPTDDGSRDPTAPHRSADITASGSRAPRRTQATSRSSSNRKEKSNRKQNEPSDVTVSQQQTPAVTAERKDLYESMTGTASSRQQQRRYVNIDDVTAGRLPVNRSDSGSRHRRAARSSSSARRPATTRVGKPEVVEIHEEEEHVYEEIPAAKTTMDRRQCATARHLGRSVTISGRGNELPEPETVFCRSDRCEHRGQQHSPRYVLPDVAAMATQRRAPAAQQDWSRDDYITHQCTTHCAGSHHHRHQNAVDVRWRHCAAAADSLQRLRQVAGHIHRTYSSDDYFAADVDDVTATEQPRGDVIMRSSDGQLWRLMRHPVGVAPSNRMLFVTPAAAAPDAFRNRSRNGNVAATMDRCQRCSAPAGTGNEDPSYTVMTSSIARRRKTAPEAARKSSRASRTSPAVRDVIRDFRSLALASPLEDVDEYMEYSPGVASSVGALEASEDSGCCSVEYSGDGQVVDGTSDTLLDVEEGVIYGCGLSGLGPWKSNSVAGGLESQHLYENTDGVRPDQPQRRTRNGQGRKSLFRSSSVEDFRSTDVDDLDDLWRPVAAPADDSEGGSPREFQSDGPAATSTPPRRRLRTKIQHKRRRHHHHHHVNCHRQTTSRVKILGQRETLIVL